MFAICTMLVVTYFVIRGIRAIFSPENDPSAKVPKGAALVSVTTAPPVASVVPVPPPAAATIVAPNPAVVSPATIGFVVETPDDLESPAFLRQSGLSLPSWLAQVDAKMVRRKAAVKASCTKAAKAAKAAAEHPASCEELDQLLGDAAAPFHALLDEHGLEAYIN